MPVVLGADRVESTTPTPLTLLALSVWNGEPAVFPRCMSSSLQATLSGGLLGVLAS